MTVSKPRKYIILQTVAAALAIVFSGGCGRDSSSPDGAPGMGASVEMRLPWTTPTDWVSYAQQVSLVTVTAERQLEFRPEVKEQGEGYVGRVVTVNIAEPIWVSSGATPVTGEQEWDTFGWTLKNGELRPFGGPHRWEVGQTYLVPIAWFRYPDGRSGGAFASMVPDGIPVTDGSLPDDLSYLTPWLREFEGLSLNEFAARLRGTLPDPLALQFWHFQEPEQRWEAVRAAQQATAVHTATAGEIGTPSP